MPVSGRKRAGVRNRTNEVRIFGRMWLKLILAVGVLLNCAHGTVAEEASHSSCRSKEERHLYHTAFREEPSKAFVEKLREYEKMHKRCMQGDVWKGSFFENSTDNTDASLPQCRYVVFKGNGGFGNRVHGLISTFLYALLTNRALIAGTHSDAQLFCNPFPESTWVLNEKEATIMRSFGRAVHVPMVIEEKPQRHKASFSLKFNVAQEDLIFFCDEAQPGLLNIPWLMMNQGRYFGPLFAGMKSFRQEMEKWFPSRAVYTHLARYLLHPKDKYWDHITSHFNAHLRGAQKRIGLQVRTFSDDDWWANERVLECAVNISHYLPHPKQITERDTTTTSRPSVSNNGSVPPTIAVFVASLHGRHLDYLNATYRDGFAADGSFVTFHSTGNVNKEGWDMEHHGLAMVDIWILSFCDVIQTSFSSTFGELAVALAGVRPFVMNIVNRPRSSWPRSKPDCMSSLKMVYNGNDWRQNNLPVCLREMSIDPCAQSAVSRGCAPTGQDCFAGQPEYIQSCKTSSPFHWQIIDSTSENGG